MILSHEGFIEIAHTVDLFLERKTKSVCQVHKQSFYFCKRMHIESNVREKKKFACAYIYIATKLRINIHENL